MVAPTTDNLILSGVFGSATSPVEQWSFRLFLADYITNSQTKRQALADATRTAWATHLAPLHPNFVVLTKVRQVVLTDNGQGKHKYLQRADGSYVMAENVTPAAGSGAASNIYPPQVAVTASLGTSTPGPRGKGRVFLPSTIHVPSVTDLRLTAGNAQTIADGCKAFLNAVNAAALAQQDTSNAVPRVSVYSAADNVQRPVTFVRVGRALDTMRSRRGDLPESYTVSTL